jgi:hypothetical protein
LEFSLGAAVPETSFSFDFSLLAARSSFTTLSSLADARVLLLVENATDRTREQKPWDDLLP